MIKNIESYRQGFIAGLDIKENYKTIIFGFELNEILDILEQHLKEPEMPTLITRAKATVMLRNFGLTDTGQAMKWVDFFIEAGMLNVKEEEKSTNYLMIKDMDGDIQKVDIAELILKLAFAGFEVKKK